MNKKTIINNNISVEFLLYKYLRGLTWIILMSLLIILVLVLILIILI